MRGPVTFAFPPSSTTCRTTMSQHSSGSQRKAITEDERLLTQLPRERRALDRKSTRLNSSHGYISYAVFCLKKKKTRPAVDLASLSLARARARILARGAQAAQR